MFENRDITEIFSTLVEIDVNKNSFKCIITPFKLTHLKPFAMCLNASPQAVRVNQDVQLMFVIPIVDKISSTIKLNRTDAQLNCSAGFMSIDLQFKQKFYGIVYAQLDRNSACKVSGNGEETAKIQIPLKGCGTEQTNTRVFSNNIVVRFHPGLEIEGDEVITVICRYPPPVVQPPAIFEPLQ